MHETDGAIIKYRYNLSIAIVLISMSGFVHILKSPQKQYVYQLLLIDIFIINHNLYIHHCNYNKILKCKTGFNFFFQICTRNRIVPIAPIRKPGAQLPHATLLLSPINTEPGLEELSPLFMGPEHGHNSSCRYIGYVSMYQTKSRHNADFKIKRSNP